MSLISIGDMAHSHILRRQTAALKLEAQTAGTELATGLATDPSKHLRGNITHLAALETSLARSEAYRTSAQGAAITTGAMQQVLSNIAQMTDDIGSALLSAGTMEDTSTMNTLLEDVDQRFQSVISALNTRVGQGSLFAGIATDGPALADAETILTALEAAIISAGAGTADETEAAVNSWFDDPAGFASIGYLGGAPAQPQRISPDDRVGIGFTAQDPGLKSTLKALALAALTHRDTLPNASEIKADLVRKSGETLMQSHADRAVLAGQIGTAEARASEALIRTSNEGNALEMLKSNLLSIDPFEAATRMENARSQLETLYAITARLSRLSLVDFLR